VNERGVITLTNDKDKSNQITPSSCCVADPRQHVLSDACTQRRFLFLFANESYFRLCLSPFLSAKLEVRWVGSVTSFPHHPRNVLLGDLVKGRGVEGHTPGQALLVVSFEWYRGMPGSTLSH